MTVGIFLDLYNLQITQPLLHSDYSLLEWLILIKVATYSLCLCKLSCSIQWLNSIGSSDHPIIFVFGSDNLNIISSAFFLIKMLQGFLFADIARMFMLHHVTMFQVVAFHWDGIRNVCSTMIHSNGYKFKNTIDPLERNFQITRNISVGEISENHILSIYMGVIFVSYKSMYASFPPSPLYQQMYKIYKAILCWTFVCMVDGQGIMLSFADPSFMSILQFSQRSIPYFIIKIKICKVHKI